MEYKQFIRLTKDYPVHIKRGFRQLLCCGNCNKREKCQLRDPYLPRHEICMEWEINPNNSIVLD